MDTYKNDLYPVNLTVLTPEDMTEFYETHAYMAKEVMAQINDSRGAVTFYDSEKIQNIYVFFSEPNLLSVPHEALHITNIMWRVIGAEYDMINDEPFAYLLTWVFEKIITSKMFKDFVSEDVEPTNMK